MEFLVKIVLTLESISLILKVIIKQEEPSVGTKLENVLLAAVIGIMTMSCGVFIGGSNVSAEEAKVEVTVSHEAEEEADDESAEETASTTTPIVPDTGVNGLSSVGAAAVVSIITVAAAVILALVIKNTSKKVVTKTIAQQNADARMRTRAERIGLTGTAVVSILTLGGFLLASNLVTPKEKETKDLTLVSDPKISMAKPADVVIALPTDAGLSGMNSHKLNIKTNSPDGYTVSINTKTEETSLVSESTSDKIKSIDGTVEAPKVLTENTWGFSTKAENETPTVGSKWAGVTAEPVVFYESNQPNYEAEDLDVYFAANVSEDISDGTYDNIIVYSILAKTDVDTIPAPTIDSITPAFGSITGGTRVTLVGDNYTKNGSSITTKVLIGDAECTDVEVYADTPQAGKDTIICTAPAHDGVNDRVDVKVETWGGEATIDDGFRYDLSDIVYVTPNIASTTAGAAQGPAFTIYGSGFINDESPVEKVTIGGNECAEFEIVSNTQITCTKGPNSGLVAGVKRVLVHHEDGRISGGTVNVTYSNTAYSEFADGMTCTTTKAIYRDPRDSQLYYVAKMADGKCWMVDNLKYTAEAGTLSQVATKALTGDGVDNSANGNYQVAKYVDPNTQDYCMGNTNMPALTVTRCGMLYNWYSATKGTGVDTMKVAGEQAAGSICPAGMKLPSSISAATTDYGLESTFADADYPILVASLNYGTVTAGTLSDDSQKWQASLQPGAAWSGMFSGFWKVNFAKVGEQAYYWSSSVATKTDGKLRAHYLSFHTNEVRTGDASYGNDTRNYGFAVRCVEE